jgi:hypothetical protein
MKIGVLYVGYNQESYVSHSLSSWIFAKKVNLANHEYIISAVSLPFKEYKERNIIEDNTISILDHSLEYKEIDSLIKEPKYISETEARNMSLQFLLANKVDVVILVDSDEFYTLEDIEKIFTYVSLERWISWFAVSLKNYVFDENTYLKIPFTPPRIFRTVTNGYRLLEMSYDNDVTYQTTLLTPKGDVVRNISHRDLPTKIIPQNIAFVRHLTWLSNEKTKEKIIYQKSRWGENGCSFEWNNELNALEFSKAYYLSNHKSYPEILKDENS